MLRWLTAGESHGAASGRRSSRGCRPACGHHRRPRGRARAPPARLRPRRPDGFEADEVDDPRRGPARHDDGRAGRRADRQHRVAEVGAGHVARPGRPGGARGAGAQRAADPPATRARRPGRACRSTASTRRGRCWSGPAPARPRRGSPSAPSPPPFCAAGPRRPAGVARRLDRCRGGARPSRCPTPADVAALDADPVRCLDAAASAAMVAEIDEAHKDGRHARRRRRGGRLRAAARASAPTRTGTGGSTRGWPAR